MSNPFEQDDAPYMVLMNDEEQYSLWPAFAEVPAGWRVALESRSRQDCIDHIEANWTDMRPKSLREAMSASA
ncbi:MbtH family protein [Streptomyces sp. NPDC019531]|uniref:MbtH family protein n=1 Tax=Streptomyces sp. NPDC019531 TaxID=3365062 RepID=UPI00384D97CC